MSRLRTACLYHKPNERDPGTGMQFLCIQGAIVIRIGDVETLFDNGKILVLRERAIMVGIGHSQNSLTDKRPASSCLSSVLSLSVNRRGVSTPIGTLSY
jgi:hypothetical protein